MTLPRLVGMVHLLPLPGSPRYAGSMDQVVDTAVSDAEALAIGGFPALMVENFGDVPFRPDRVGAETAAAITRCVLGVAETTGLPVGVNVLRNDAMTALGIAAATGASVIRVNVLTGVMITDQGPLVGRADELMRARAVLAPQVEVWADLMVKHATPPPGLDIGQSARDLVERGLADAVIVSGSGTGSEPDLAEAALVRSVLPTGTRLVAGSGVRPENLARVMEVVDTVIVGSSLKREGRAMERVDPARVEVFVAAAAGHGLL